MKRQVSLEEISDGKLYGSNDMVKADCHDCKGCSACCHGMGSSITLDPYDIFRLTSEQNCSFEALMEQGNVELNVVDGIILPNLKMDERTQNCSFLDADGRCSIHRSRPGICRIFPLGRFYEKESFRYFLQVHECRNTNRSKIKVKKWVDTPNLQQYEKFIIDWHYFLKKLEVHAEKTQDDAWLKDMNLYLLKNFYLNKYLPEVDFYTQFEERLQEAKKLLR